MLKNWGEELCDEESFNSSIKGNLRVFQNHTKQEKINVVFHHFPSLDLNKIL